MKEDIEKQSEINEMESFFASVSNELKNQQEQTQSEKYKLLEDTAYNQIVIIQNSLSANLENGNFDNLRNYVSGIKDLTATYNDLSRQRQLAEIQENKMLPIEVLDRYKSNFYPILQAGVDELRISIENFLPVSHVADFQVAWKKSYHRYKEAANKAEEAIIDYKIIAAEEALHFAYAKDNNRLKAGKVAAETVDKAKKERIKKKQ